MPTHQISFYFTSGLTGKYCCYIFSTDKANRQGDFVQCHMESVAGSYLRTPEVLGWLECSGAGGRQGEALGGTDRVPLGVDVLRTEADVGVGGAGPQPICLADLLDLTLDAQDSASLPVSLGQCCLELLMCCQQALWATGRKQLAPSASHR